MSNAFLKQLPWVVAAVCVGAVGAVYLGPLAPGMGANGPAPVQSELGQATPAQVVPVQTAPVQAAPQAVVVATPEPAEAPDPQNVSDQLAALLVETEQEAQGAVEVTRNDGFSLDVLQDARDAALSGEETAQTSGDGAIDSDFFAMAQANLERDRQCIDDLKILAAQARVYFPSGGLSADQSGIEKARLLGILAQQCTGVQIEVSGHSDPSGDPVRNQQLSLERANEVVSRVAASGVNSNLFVAVGLGSSVPSSVQGPLEDAYYDRRVEFSVIETPIQASFTAPFVTSSAGRAQTAACVAQLQAAVQGASIEYAPRGMTVSDGDFAVATQLARIAANCPEARLRVIGQHSDDPRAAETGSTGRLRAIVLMGKLVEQGLPAEQIILGAPSEPRPLAGLSDSRIDFDVILEEF